MLKLAPLAEVERSTHLRILQDRFDVKLSEVSSALAQNSYDHLLIEHLKKSVRTILVGSPGELEAIASYVVDQFPEFTSYLRSRRRGSFNSAGKHKNTLDIVNACFDYDWFCDQKNGWGAYALVKSHNLRICPYCQANHVNVHVTEVKGPRGAKTFRMRPPLDHYLPKSIYPYLAVSLSNLVPSCAQCNSGVKASDDPRGMGLAHPMDTTKVLVRFSIKGTLRRVVNGPVEIDEIELSLAGSDGPSTSHLEAFRLQERYEWYRHEIKDLIDRHEQHLELASILQRAVPRERYVLGFLEVNAEGRSLGLCLRDIYNELSSNG